MDIICFGTCTGTIRTVMSNGISKYTYSVEYQRVVISI